MLPLALSLHLEPSASTVSLIVSLIVSMFQKVRVRTLRSSVALCWAQSERSCHGNSLDRSIADPASTMRSTGKAEVKLGTKVQPFHLRMDHLGQCTDRFRLLSHRAQNVILHHQFITQETYHFLGCASGLKVQGAFGCGRSSFVSASALNSREQDEPDHLRSIVWLKIISSIIQ